jgi:LacI family transcriptional regulator
MRDVGALAGVSLKTVSRVVNGESGVSTELVGRVEEAIRKLGYRHNMTASTLRRADQKSATIGLLLEDVANPFSSSLHRAIEDAARERNVLVFAGSSDEDIHQQRAALHAFGRRRVDGLIIVPAGGDHGDFHLERLAGRPLVFVDRPPGVPNADSVTVDNRPAARRAIDHLAVRGHQRIAFLGDLRSIWTAAERHAGYVEGLATRGIRLDPALARFDLHSIELAKQATLELLALPDPPTALFTGQNLVTIGAIRALKQRQAQHRVALIGFDEILLADLLDPPVSVIAQDPPAIGKAAAELLFARMDGDDQPARHVVVPTMLIPRGSGELPAP